MAGLNNLISNTAQQTTTMPAWFDTAQQNVVNQAGSALNQAPAPQNTVAQQAVNQLSGPTNAFTQAGGTLQNIASGAANPWIVTPQYSQQQSPYGGARTAQTQPSSEYSPFAATQPGDDFGGGRAGTMSAGAAQGATGPALGGLGAQPTDGMQPMGAMDQGQPSGYSVAPNPYTALGGLFAAQNQQLQQLMPNVTAPVTGANVATGNFGSLRGQTAYDKAMADAQAQLFAQQNQAALQNQQTGVQAGIGAGNVAQQGINNALTVGQYQQAAPFTNVSNYGKVIGGVQAPTTVSNQTQLSPLNQVGGLATLGNGVLGQLFGNAASGTNAATSGLFGSGGIGSFFSGLTGKNDAASQTAANDLAAKVNMGIVAPDAGGTPYVPLPGTDSSLNQGEVG
jgi:hypothetical protein